METPTIGRMVHYTLSEADVDRIIASGLNSNNLRAGSEFAAVVLSLPAHHGDRQPANLTVFLDGPMTYWAIGKLQDAAATATEARTPGTWHWPERLPAAEPLLRYPEEKDADKFGRVLAWKSDQKVWYAEAWKKAGLTWQPMPPPPQ